MWLKWLTVVAVGAISPAVQAGDLRETLAAHAAAVARIRTISFRFTSTSDHTGRVERQDGEYLRSGDDQRVTIRQGDAQFTEYVTAERLVHITREPSRFPGMNPSSANIRPNAGYFSSVAVPHPWAATLMALNSKRGTASQPLDEHVAEYLADPTTRIEDGLIVITGANGWATIRLDPKHNYLIVSHDTKAPHDISRKSQQIIVSHEQVTDFRQVAPAIYFPHEYTATQQVGNSRPIRQAVTFTAVKVNEAVAPDTFRPKYLDGTNVLDLIRGTEYIADANGSPKGPEKPHTKMAVGVVNANTTTVQVPGKPTAEEDSRTGWWLLPAGLSVLLAGVAVGLWRRGR